MVGHQLTLFKKIVAMFGVWALVSVIVAPAASASVGSANAKVAIDWTTFWVPSNPAGIDLSPSLMQAIYGSSTSGWVEVDVQGLP